jgi:acetolactate synthase-1/3 small subunit
MKHIISMLIENESGALSRVAGLFSARGYNIHALTVAPTEDESLSRLTLVTSGTEQQIEQIVKHLNRLLDVVKVLDLTEGSHIERELMLIKVNATGEAREEYKRLADIFRGDIIDVTPTTYTIQMVGETKKLDAFIDAIDPGLILETVRSGTVGVMRGEKCLHV